MKNNDERNEILKGIVEKNVKSKDLHIYYYEKQDDSFESSCLFDIKEYLKQNLNEIRSINVSYLEIYYFKNRISSVVMLLKIQKGERMSNNLKNFCDLAIIDIEKDDFHYKFINEVSNIFRDTIIINKINKRLPISILCEGMV